MKAKELEQIILMLKTHKNTVVPNQIVKKYGKNKIIESLKQKGFVCIMKQCEHIIPDGKRSQTDIDYILEVVE